MASLPCHLHRRAASDALADDLRDDLRDARRELAVTELMFRAALDQLALVATVPEQYEQIQRELRKEREEFMKRSLSTP